MLNRLALLAALVFLSPRVSGIDIIASTGDQAPGFASGTRYSSFLGVSSSPDGRIALAGQAGGPVGGQFAVWAGPESALQLLLKEGDTVAGLAGATFNGLPTNTPVIARNGDVAFIGQVNASPQNSQALIARLGGRVIGIARAGTRLPGTDGQNPVRSVTDFRLTGAGLAFRASLEDGGLGVWFHDGTSLQRIAMPDTAAPGETDADDCVFTGTTIASPISLNESGLLSFAARTRRGDDAPFDARCRNGLFTWQDGAYKLRLAEGQPLPGNEELRLSSIADTFINNAGDIAFTGLARASNATGLYFSAWVLRAGGDQPQLYAAEGERQGDATFDSGVSGTFDAITSGSRWITSFDNPDHALLLRGGPRNSGTVTLPTTQASQLERLVARGGQAPDFPSGWTFVNVAPATFNGSGTSAFFGTVAPGGDPRRAEIAVWRASGGQRPERAIYRGLQLPNGAEVIGPLAWGTAARRVTSTEGGAGANISESGRVVLILSAVSGSGVGSLIARTDPFGSAPVVPPVLPPAPPADEDRLGWFIPLLFLLLDEDEDARR